MENEAGPRIRKGDGRGGQKARSTERAGVDQTINSDREAKGDECSLNSAEGLRTYLPDL